jgi:peptidoglycan/LPS O-acetylase OafA/YrhL
MRRHVSDVREAAFREHLAAAPAGLAAAPARTQARAGHGRLHFMDNLRVVLTVLIVLQHASFAYAPGQWWYFADSQQEPLLASFFVVNRSFRMSLFFLIAGYFMPYVVDRKGTGQYLGDRFRRLGLPILGFLIFVFPLLMYAYYINFRGYPSIDFFTYFYRIYCGIGGHRPPHWSGPDWPDRQLGHLWFIEMLLVYTTVYAGWRWLRRYLLLPPLGHLPQPRLTLLLPLIIAVAALSYWVRLYYPIYSWGAYLGVLQLSLADLPRDLACFILGVVAYRNDWLLGLPSSIGYRWLAVGVLGAAVFVACDIAGWSFFSVGGQDLRAVLYPLWEALTCFGLCFGLPTLFRERLDWRSPFLGRLSVASYGVYVLHLPLVVALQYSMAHLALSAAGKFLVVGALAVPLSFLLVLLLRRWPPARKVF